jgi:hypothetical protein
MCENRPSVRRVQRLHPLQEHEKGRRVDWHPVVGPSRELALLHFSAQFAAATRIFHAQSAQAIVGQFSGLQQGNLNI